MAVEKGGRLVSVSESALATATLCLRSLYLGQINDGYTDSDSTFWQKAMQDSSMSLKTACFYYCLDEKVTPLKLADTVLKQFNWYKSPDTPEQLKKARRLTLAGALWENYPEDFKDRYVPEES